MRRLTFRFDFEKLVNALAFFAHAGVRDLTKLKAAKLLYLADQRHFFQYGRPITGDRYIAMDLGPVPESAYQLIGRLCDPDEVDDPVREHAKRRLAINKGFLRQYPVLRAKGEPELDVFSDTELDTLKAIVKEFGNRRAKELVGLTHGHVAYQRADAGRAPGSSVDLPYEYFFDDAPAASADVRALAESEQEERDFANALDAAGRMALHK